MPGDMKRRIIVLSLLTLSACVAPRQSAPLPPPPAPVQTPAPAPPPPPPPADWRDRALTPGDWRYQRAAAGGEAIYGVEPRLALRCARDQGQIWLIWPGAAGASVAIQTTETRAMRTGTIVGAELRVAFAARDPLLDQMAYSRGRIMLTAGGQALIVPSWPEIARVIEDCR